jgi:hypothetical protein
MDLLISTDERVPLHANIVYNYKGGKQHFGKIGDGMPEIAGGVK